MYFGRLISLNDMAVFQKASAFEIHQGPIQDGLGTVNCRNVLHSGGTEDLAFFAFQHRKQDGRVECNRPVRSALSWLPRVRL
jgi:hypothetical protein